MGHVAIVYATTHGTTRRVAERLAEGLRAAGDEVTLVDLTGAPGQGLPDADRVVVASAVYSNQHHDDLLRWLRVHADDLADLDTVLVSISLAAAIPTDEGDAMCWDYVGELTEVTGWEPGRVHLVAGSLDESAYDPATKALLRVATWRRALGAEGDRSFTDWDAVDALAGSLGSS